MAQIDKVALLIDFENLVRGIAGDTNEPSVNVDIDPEILMRLSEEYGHVVLANAYADWRDHLVNQYQTDLYKLGIDLVHVFARRHGISYKNAVDVKMAVDATEIMFLHPQISTFVIVSGDRDFIHVLKTLRKYGKEIIGVSPEHSASGDLAALCDRFVKYEALANAYVPGSGEVESADSPDLRTVEEVLKGILRRRPEGVKGAQIKPLIRRQLGASFDESEYGYSRLTDLLRQVPGISLNRPNADGGDVTVTLGEEKPSDPHGSRISSGSTVLSAVFEELRAMRFESNCLRRRRILTSVYRALQESDRSSWQLVSERLLDDDGLDDLSLSVTVLGKYFVMLRNGGAVVFDPPEQDASFRERSIRLVEDISSSEELIRYYERSVAYISFERVQGGPEVGPEEVCQILGLTEEKNNLEYAGRLLDEAKSG